MEDKYLAINRPENPGHSAIWSRALTWAVEFDDAVAKELQKLDKQA